MRASLDRQVRTSAIPGRGDGIGRRSGLKHRRRKAWGFDFPPRHHQQQTQAGYFEPASGAVANMAAFQITLGYRAYSACGSGTCAIPAERAFNKCNSVVMESGL